MSSFWNVLPSDLSGACMPLHSLALILSGCVLEVPDDSFVLFEFQVEFLFLFVYPFVEIGDEVVEVVLSFELGFAEHGRFRLVVVDAPCFLDRGTPFPLLVEGWSVSVYLEVYFISP